MNAVDVLSLADVVVRDCGYGFSAHALLLDGTPVFHTTGLYPTRGEAKAAVFALYRAALVANAGAP